MVKLVCDRCGKECIETYSTINIRSYNVHSDNSDKTCGAIGYACGLFPIEELNRSKHYCINCVHDFENFIVNLD